jgi:hypothetical protein
MLYELPALFTLDDLSLSSRQRHDLRLNLRPGLPEPIRTIEWRRLRTSLGEVDSCIFGLESMECPLKPVQDSYFIYSGSLRTLWLWFIKWCWLNFPIIELVTNLQDGAAPSVPPYSITRRRVQV